MIYVIAAISLLFIIIGFVVNEGNAKYLLAGYNTMSEESRKRLDIKAFLPYFRKFHVFLGISLFTLCFILHVYISENLAGIFFAVYPIIAYVYFALTSAKYYDKEGAKWSKFGVVLLLLALLFVIAILSYGFKNNVVSFDQEKIEFHGSYGEVVPKAQIKRLELVNQIPKITVRTNGFALGEIRKGYFMTGQGEVVKLIINAKQSPLILLTKTNDKKIYYSAKNESNKELYDKIKQVLWDIN